MRHRTALIAALFLLALSCGKGLNQGGTNGAGNGEGSGESDGSNGSGGGSGSGSGTLGDISSSPASGSHYAVLTVAGSGFESSSTVTIGGVSCAKVSTTESQIICTIGAHTPGVADVVVTQGEQTKTLTNAFTYKAYLYVATSSSDKIDQFEITSSGALTALSEGPLSASGSPSVLIHPSNTSTVFGLNLTTPSLSAYGITATGAISELAGSPTTIAITNRNFVVPSGGGILYQAFGTTGSSPTEITSFISQLDGSLSQANTAGTGRSAMDVIISPDGTSLYSTLGGGSPSLAGYQVGSGGSMIDHATGYSLVTSPGNIAISNDGAFVFQVDLFNNIIVSAPRNSSTGVLGSGTSTSFPNPTNTSLQVHPTKRCLYILDSVSNSGRILVWDATTGELSDLASSMFSTGAGPTHMAFDPGVSFAFVSNGSGNVLSRYSIASDCKLTVLGSGQTTDTGPSGIAVH